ncbi:MAG: hypothetical protein ACT4TC_15430 [Myxococcaceae bacterium]
MSTMKGMDLRLGRAFACVGLLALVSRPAQAQTVLFFDDYESGTFRTSDAPPGKWDNVENATATATATLSAAAAHRGTFGVRFAKTGPGASSPSVALVHAHVSRTGSQYGRAWVRLVQTSTDNFFLTWFFGAGYSCSGEIELNGSATRLNSNGWASSVYAGVEAPVPLMVGSWFLLEWGLTGIGTSNGRRQAWINGVLGADLGGLNFSGADVNQLKVGFPWSDLPTLATVDFDDVRVSSSPPVSGVALTVASAAAAEQCVPVTVTLRDSSGVAALAPYSLLLAAQVTGVTASLFTDGNCGAPGNTWTVPAGQNQGNFSFRPGSNGDAQIIASHPDLLGALPRLVSLSALPDGTACAGSAACASGQCSAGFCTPLDAGTQQPPPPGPTDAGAASGEELFLDELNLKVGCSCNGTNAIAGLELVALAVLSHAWRRRRRRT